MNLEMHHNMMTFKIKNWKLTLLGLVFVVLFASLGNWQLLRAHQKEILLKSFAERRTQMPLTAQVLDSSSDLRFYRAELQGSFDNAHTLLLDNKTYQGHVGYEVYTPFLAKGLKTPILVDRGFVLLGSSRKILPVIEPIYGEVTILGMLNSPPKYVALGQMQESPQITWPLRVEFIHLSELSQLLGYALSPYTLSLTQDKTVYAMDWQIVTISPERHRGYAVQWFALALTLLILCIALNRGSAT